MSVKKRGCLPPSTFLPPLRNLATLNETQIGEAIRNLHEFFCRLPNSLGFQTSSNFQSVAADSGYASETDAEVDGESLKCDEFERNFAHRWLTGFIGRANEVPLEKSISDHLVEAACSIFSYLANEPKEEPADDGKLGMFRTFSFSIRNDPTSRIHIEVHDTPMQTGDDHTDVGLQTWGASIVLSERISKDPEGFRISNTRITSSSRIIELGAGTGLLSLFLSSLVPHISESRPAIVATDYHPTVLANLEANITSHMAKSPDAAPITSCHLDWSAPSHEEPLNRPADMLIAADVSYAPEHAAWLRDCAKCLLANEGVFWLMVSVRPNGKFFGISNTVDAAFEDEMECIGSNGKRLSIASVQMVEKKEGVGRADEVGYRLFKIVWS